MSVKMDRAMGEEEQRKDALIPPWWVDYVSATAADIRPCDRPGYVVQGLEPALAAALVAVANAHKTPVWLKLVRDGTTPGAPITGKGAYYVVPGKVNP